MDFLKKFDLTPMKLLKLSGVLLAALLVLSIAMQFVGPSIRLAIPQGLPGMDGAGGYAVGSAPSPSGYYGGDYDMAYTKEESVGYSSGMATLSSRNAASIMPIPPAMPTSGNNAEDYEVTEYSASIETRKKDETCAAFTELKAKSYVIFESSNDYDRGCSHRFKVEHKRVDEVLAWINDFDPKNLSENSYTIKRQIDDYTSEEEVLLKKRTSIDETLRSATAAYDEVTRLATQSRDASSLAQIIDSRVQIIERLTQERININTQLDRLARAKADQIDRLEYTYFQVDVFENKYIDTEMIKESWKQSLRDVVHVINDALQGVTINLLALFFVVIQYALYALILLVIAKYGWALALYIWKR